MDDPRLCITYLQAGLPFISVVRRGRVDYSFPLFFFLSACRIARDEEETSTSQAGGKRGLTWGTPSTSSIISSLSMDELRAYCEILDDIDIMISDDPARNTVGGDDNAVFFTKYKLAVGLCFPVPALVKQFLHFTRAPPALVHLNVIRILTGCFVLDLLYQLDLYLVEVCFAYTLRVVQGGRMSMSAQTLRLQFVIGLPNSPKSDAKGLILVRGLGMRHLVPPTFRLMLTMLCTFQVCISS